MEPYLDFFELKKLKKIDFQNGQKDIYETRISTRPATLLVLVQRASSTLQSLVETINIKNYLYLSILLMFFNETIQKSPIMAPLRKKTYHTVHYSPIPIFV
jgi:hypothetical protein